jgi:hypothetical protein
VTAKMQGLERDRENQHLMQVEVLEREMAALEEQEKRRQQEEMLVQMEKLALTKLEAVNKKNAISGRDSSKNVVASGSGRE